MERFLALGLPTRKHEDWRYTDLTPLARGEYRPPETTREIAESVIAPFTYVEESSVRIVFVDGRLSPRLSRLDDLPQGLVIEGYSPDREDPSPESCALRELTTAAAAEGIHIVVSPGTRLKAPIHLLHLVGPQSRPALVAVDGRVELGEGAEATIIERWAGLDDTAESLVLSRTDMRLGAGARLRHYRIQKDGRRSFHLASSQIRQERSSSFRSTLLQVGAGTARQDLDVLQQGPGAETDLDGLYLVDGTRHADQRVLVRHLASQGRSTQRFKGIVDGRGTAVFNGRIHVEKGTVGNDARQTNANLLLSDEAAADTRPQLEIHADDVKCSHGATIGQLDADALFYLRSRGLSEQRARNLLTWAFAAEIVDSIDIASLRERVGGFLAERAECGSRSEETPR